MQVRNGVAPGGRLRPAGAIGCTGRRALRSRDQRHSPMRSSDVPAPGSAAATSAGAATPAFDWARALEGLAAARTRPHAEMRGPTAWNAHLQMSPAPATSLSARRRCARQPQAATSTGARAGLPAAAGHVITRFPQPCQSSQITVASWRPPSACQAGWWPRAVGCLKRRVFHTDERPVQQASPTPLHLEPTGWQAQDLEPIVRPGTGHPHAAAMADRGRWRRSGSGAVGLCARCFPPLSCLVDSWSSTKRKTRPQTAVRASAR